MIGFAALVISLAALAISIASLFRLPQNRSRFTGGGVIPEGYSATTTLDPDEHLIRPQPDGSGYRCVRSDHQGKPCRVRWIGGYR
jgi:hypothetical protein